MKKNIAALLLSTTISFAGLVDGIAIIVNDTPITLYDIDNKIQTNHINKDQAVAMLIDEALYNSELKQQNITVDIFDIDNYIDQLAARNNMSSLDFKALVRQQQNYELFKEQIKNQLRHQKLIKKIATGKLKIASTEDLKLYYKNNIEKYSIAKKIDVIAYSSKDKRLLQQIKKNPMMINQNVKVENLTLDQDKLNPEVKYVVNSTQKKKFSAIFAQNRAYNMFFIKDKKEFTTIPFEQVKDRIFNEVMQIREQNYLNEYFETLKITANIRILR